MWIQSTFTEYFLRATENSEWIRSPINIAVSNLNFKGTEQYAELTCNSYTNLASSSDNLISFWI